MMTRHAASSALMALTKVGDRVVAVGERGIVVYSDDEGASWTQADVPVSLTLTSVTFTEGGEGWAVGHSGVVLRSQDRGATWGRIMDGRDVARTVIAAIDDVEQDGDELPFELRVARMRAEAVSDAFPSDPLFDIIFLNDEVGMAVGAFGLVLRTTNGGNDWDVLPYMLKLDRHVYVAHATLEAIYLMGESGLFMKSIDGGRYFSAIKAPDHGTYFGIASSGGDTFRLAAFGLNGRLAFGRGGPAAFDWTTKPRGNGVSITSGRWLNDGRLALAGVDGVVRVVNDKMEIEADGRPDRIAPLNDLIAIANGRLITAGMAGIQVIQINTPDL